MKLFQLFNRLQAPDSSKLLNMKRRDFFRNISVAAAAAAATGCTLSAPTGPSRNESATLPADGSGISVKTGLTDNNPASEAFSFNRDFYVFWQSVAGAHHYEIRISPAPITRVNWDNAVVLAGVPASGKEVEEAMLEVQPEIYPDRCEGCGTCLSVCPRNAISLEGRKAVINAERCGSCGECFRACRFGAVKNSCYGEWYYFAVRGFSSDGTPFSGIAATTSAFKKRYTNALEFCGLCGPSCYILYANLAVKKALVPGRLCPKNAIKYYQTGPDEWPVYIEKDKCINCGLCYHKCLEYGAQSIRVEVISGPGID